VLLKEGQKVDIPGVGKGTIEQIISDRRISVKPDDGGPNVTVQFSKPFQYEETTEQRKERKHRNILGL
jgi:hypothetical protein